MFCHFWQKFVNSKWSAFLKIFPKVSIVYCLDTLAIKKFDKIALSLTVKEIAYILRFEFLVKIRKFKMAAIFENFSKSGYSILLRYPAAWGLKISTKQFCVLPLLAKIRKFKMAAIFEKIAKSQHSILLRHRGGRKFLRNCSISNG